MCSSYFEIETDKELNIKNKYIHINNESYCLITLNDIKILKSEIIIYNKNKKKTKYYLFTKYCYYEYYYYSSIYIFSI